MEKIAIDTPKAPSVADLLGVALALEADETRDPGSLRARERALGLACAEAGVRDPSRQLVAWLYAREDAASQSALRVRSAIRAAGALLALAGGVCGWAAALGALAFESGSGRINVVLVLALLVAAPVAFLLLSVIAALPHTGLLRVPGAELLTGGLRWLSTGRVALRLIPAAQRDSLAALWGRGVGRNRLYGAARKWLLLTLSQSAALAFGAGAAIGTLGLVVFTDLAFGWSTTLEIASPEFHFWVRWMSWPWSTLWPEASPSLELVEATRFFRVAPAVPDAVDPALYGRWWPFVLAAIACYTIAPRAVWAAFSAWRLRRASRAALLQTPGVGEVLDRMRSPLVETHPSGLVRGDDGQRGPSGSSGQPGDSQDADIWAEVPLRADAVVCWADAASDEEIALLLQAPGVVIARAGGRCSLAEDRAAIAAAAHAADSVAAFVRGFEPPVAEFLDFLRDLRESLGDGPRIDVVPLGARAHDLRVWSTALAKQGDPWLRVVRGPVANDV